LLKNPNLNNLKKIKQTKLYFELEMDYLNECTIIELMKYQPFCKTVN